MYYFISNDVRMAKITLRKARARSVTWNSSIFSMGEIKAMANLVDSELYQNFNKAA